MKGSSAITKKIHDLKTQSKSDPKILSCILFGSYLKEESFRDIDVCFILNPNHKDKENAILIKYINSFPSYFDFSIFSQLPLYIQVRVQNEGKILFNNNYDSLFEIFLIKIREYDDFKPHYDVFLEAVKNG